MTSKMIRIFLFIFLTISSLQAHVFPSELDLRITDDKASLKLSVPKNELYLWFGTEIFPEDKELQKTLLKDFSDKYFQLFTNGENLQAQLENFESEKREYEYMQNGKSDIEVHDFLHFSINYPLVEPIEELEIIPPHNPTNDDSDQSFRSLVNIQMNFELVDKGFRKNCYLTQLTYFVLNKEKPFESEFYHTIEGKKESPGTDSRWFSSLNAFLNISDYELRQDILFPLDYFLDQLGIRYDEEELTEEIQKTIFAEAEKFIKSNFSFTINGEEKNFENADVQLTMHDLNNLIHNDGKKDKKYVFLDTLLAISFKTYTKEKIHSLKWKVADNILDKYIKRYNLFIRHQDKSKEAVELSSAQSSFNWQREKTTDDSFTIETPKILFLKLPLWALIFIPLNMFCFAYYLLKKKTVYLAGTAIFAACTVSSVFIDLYVIPSPFQPKINIDKNKAQELTEILLKETYECFAQRDEEQLYDKLEKAVQSEALEDLYLTIQKQIKSTKDDEAQVEIDQIKLINAELKEQAYNTEKLSYEFQVKAQWQVDGSLVHWGHAHKRSNLYSGHITIAAKEKSSWKILSTEVDELKEN